MRTLTLVLLFGCVAIAIANIGNSQNQQSAVNGPRRQIPRGMRAMIQNRRRRQANPNSNPLPNSNTNPSQDQNQNQNTKPNPALVHGVVSFNTSQFAWNTTDKINSRTVDVVAAAMEPTAVVVDIATVVMGATVAMVATAAMVVITKSNL